MSRAARAAAVIPTFGRPALLAIAIDSVLAQTMPDLELIVVIDGDDPPTIERLRAFDDPRLRWIVQAAKGGPGHARDTGALAASAPWVAFLDDDDAWLPAKLERQLAVAPPDGRAVVMTQSYVRTPDGEYVRPARPYDNVQPVDEWLFDRTTWLQGGLNFVQTSSLMFPQAMFATLGFGHSRQHEEWELVIRAVKGLGYRLVTVPEPLVYHYAGQPRATLSNERTLEHSLRWIEGLGPLVTPRAYSGFVLLAAGQYSAGVGEWSALPTLLRTAFAKGRPTAKQLFRTAMTWAVPLRWRKRLPALIRRRRPIAETDRP